MFLFSDTKAHGYLVTESTAKKMIKGENLSHLVALFLQVYIVKVQVTVQVDVHLLPFSLVLKVFKKVALSKNTYLFCIDRAF